MSILILDKYMLVRQILSEPGRDGWHRPVYGSSTPLQTQTGAKLELQRFNFYLRSFFANICENCAYLLG